MLLTKHLLRNSPFWPWKQKFGFIKRVDKGWIGVETVLCIKEVSDLFQQVTEYTNQIICRANFGCIYRLDKELFWLKGQYQAFNFHEVHLWSKQRNHPLSSYSLNENLCAFPCTVSDVVMAKFIPLIRHNFSFFSCTLSESCHHFPFSVKKKEKQWKLHWWDLSMTVYFIQRPLLWLKLT